MDTLDEFIRVDNLRKVYRARGEPVKALNGVSFGVHQGDFVAITGPSGCGKSTLISILGGMCHPTKEV